jgi:regulator of RNase E activity RraB
VDTLYWVRISMLDSGVHGMGTAAEAEALRPLEDRLVDAATNIELVYVGRLRNDGVWQLTFYGSSNRDDALSELAREVRDIGRETEVGTMDDADWSYYNGFLRPDRERRQWMQDRRLVDVLEKHGDSLTAARRVDHWAYFRTADARDGFVVDTSQAGFEVEATPDDADEPFRFGAQVFRTDSVELEEIHDVVMMLIRLVERHEGGYDGWKTSVKSA